MTPGRVAMAIVALLVMAGLGLLVTGGADGPATVVAGPSTTAVTPAPDSSTTPAVAAPVIAPGPQQSLPKRPTPGVAPTTLAGAAAVVPGPVTPPPPATYRYRYGGSGPTVDGTLTVTAGPGATRQIHRLTAGADSQQTTFDWSAAARTAVSAGGAAAPGCAWAPGLLSLRLPLTTGATWKADSTCTSKSATATSSIRRIEESKVEGSTRTQVAGRPVDVWIISRHTLTEIAATSSAKAFVEAQSSELFAPSLGLVVYQVTRTATPKPDGTTVTTTQTTELLDQRPV